MSKQSDSEDLSFPFKIGDLVKWKLAEYEDQDILFLYLIVDVGEFAPCRRKKKICLTVYNSHTGETFKDFDTSVYELVFRIDDEAR